MGAARSSMACIGLLIAAIMGCSVVVDAAKPAHGHRHEYLRNHVNRVLAHAEATAPTTGSTTHFFTDAVLDHYSYRFGSLSGGSSNLRWKQRFYVNDKYWKGDGAPVFLYIGGEGPQGAPSDHLFMATLAQKTKSSDHALERPLSTRRGVVGLTIPTLDRDTPGEVPQ